jgi:hypothetical protein
MHSKFAKTGDLQGKLRSNSLNQKFCSTEASNPLVAIERPSPESAVVKFWPTEEQQRELAAEGLQGQLVVEYEVDRTSRAGEILVRISTGETQFSMP